MAKTIFDVAAPRAPRPTFRPIAAEEPREEIPSQAEEGEPEVGSEPPVGRQAFSYLAPRKGIDAPGDFRSCMSCASFVPERAFRAATTGNHCVLLGSFPVEPHGNCFRYHPWANGKPVEAVVEAHAMACLNGVRAPLGPFDVGYCEDHGHSHRCRSCRHYDAVGDADTEGPECEAFEALNRELPAVFQINESIEPDAGCNLWAEPVPDESNLSGQEGQQ